MRYKSLEDVHGTIDTTTAANWRKRFMLFLGPAFLVAVGYMDPGNWATDIAGGSRYGYTLIWVLLMSNMIALLLQSLSARLGIVRGIDLAQASRATYPKAVNISLWLLAEIAIAACDLAEVLGMAIGLNLLFGLPLMAGVSLAILDTFLILYLQSKGMRYMEAFILSLVALIGLAFTIELLFAKPDVTEVVKGFYPSLADKGALFIAIGIIGATVMPHNLYLHSSLVQTRRSSRDEAGVKTALKYNLIDSTIALNLAFFVNASILILAGAVFYKNGLHHIVEIQDAHKMLAPLLGEKLAPILFAVALIAAGQSSTITGTLAGQIVMEGYLDLRIAPWLRRLITRLIAVVPALLVIYYMGEDKVGDMLIISQVILSLQLGFAIIPLIHFVSDKSAMGIFAIKNSTKTVAWMAAAIIIVLNGKLVFDTMIEWMGEAANPFVIYGIVIPVVIAATLLLLLIVYYALKGVSKIDKGSLPHEAALDLPALSKTDYERIGICVDFSPSDLNAIKAAVNHGNEHTEYLLIHVVESAGAYTMGDQIHDYETNQDYLQLKDYSHQLQKQGYNVTEVLGFGKPGSEIPAIALKNNIELLVVGKHGHVGIMDFIFGETIATVRHKVDCAVLVV